MAAPTVRVHAVDLIVIEQQGLIPIQLMCPPDASARKALANALRAVANQLEKRSA